MVPMQTFVSMLLEPSSGSKSTTYLPWCSARMRLVELLARDDAAVPAPLEHVEQDVVREGVELLDLLALHVRLAGVAEQVGEARGADARVDDADGEGDVVEERGELAGGARRRMHPVEDVLAKRGPDDGGGGGAEEAAASDMAIASGFSPMRRAVAQAARSRGHCSGPDVHGARPIASPLIAAAMPGERATRSRRRSRTARQPASQRSRSERAMAVDRPREADPLLVRLGQPRHDDEPRAPAEPRHARRHRARWSSCRSTRASSTARARSFAPNPDGYDPDYHVQLAIDSGCNAYAAPLGFLEAVADKFAGQIPLILKLNNSDTLAKVDQPCSAVTGSVKDALRLGCAAIGYTIYPGSGLRNQMYEDLRELILEAKDAGLAVGRVGLPARRGPLEGGRDGGRRGGVRGADRRAARRARHQGQAAEGRTSSRPRRRRSSRSTTSRSKTLADRVRHVRAERLQRQAHRHLLGRRGRRTPPALLDEVRELADGGAFGSIMGRNAFQRPRAEALKLLHDVMDIFKNAK